MLTMDEKTALYQIIALSIGEDPTVKLYKERFNESTVDVVEDMISANKICNSNMKKLISDILGASSTLSKGWLRRTLKIANKTISEAELNGYGCSVATKSRWRTEIINSTI